MPTIVVAAAIVVEGGRVLLTQRKAGTHLAGAWEFPGGKVEPGEDPREALRRELLEETGIEARVGEIVDVVFHRYEDAGKAVLLLFYEASRAAGSQQPRAIDVAAVEWAARDQLGEARFPPADVAVLEKVRAMLVHRFTRIDALGNSRERVSGLGGAQGNRLVPRFLGESRGARSAHRFDGIEALAPSHAPSSKRTSSSMSASDHWRRTMDRRRAEYYARVMDFCAAQLDASGVRPVVVGISGPQGAGKSTLAEAVAGAFGDAGVRALTCSIDDFYLTYDEQRALAERHPGNPYLLYRGYPGTHDVALGSDVLDALRAGRPVSIPRYDKSAHGARGDRAIDSVSWRAVSEKLDLVLFEGWMLGFTPVATELAPGAMAVPNAYLARYARWHERLDAFVWLEAQTGDFIVEWRVDSERARRTRGECTLTDAEARDYIGRFMPAYELYLPGLRASQPGRATLHVVLGRDRQPAG